MLSLNNVAPTAVDTVTDLGVINGQRMEFDRQYAKPKNPRVSSSATQKHSKILTRSSHYTLHSSDPILETGHIVWDPVLKKHADALERERMEAEVRG